MPQLPPSADPAIVNHAIEIARLSSRMTQLEDKLSARLDDIDTHTKDLVQAWETANGVLKFVKVLASLGTAIGVLYGVIKLFWTGHP